MYFIFTRSVHDGRGARDESSAAASQLSEPSLVPDTQALQVQRARNRPAGQARRRRQEAARTSAVAPGSLAQWTARRPPLQARGDHQRVRARSCARVHVRGDRNALLGPPQPWRLEFAEVRTRSPTAAAARSTA